MLTNFHPIPSNISVKKDVAAIFAILQQKCCKNAAKKFFFNEHPFWLFLSYKKLPIPKFSCFAQKNNPMSPMCSHEIGLQPVLEVLVEPKILK